MSSMEAPEATAPVAEPSVAPGEPAAAPEAQSWVGPSQEEWAGLQQQHAALLNWARQQAAAAQQEGQPEVPRPDPFADDFQEQLDRYVDYKTSAFRQTYEQMELAAGQELAYDVISDYQAREGEFLVPEKSTELAFKLAKGFLPQAMQRYGHSDRAGEAALEMSCKFVRELEQEIGKQYHDRQTNQLATLAGARSEPGAPGQATQIVTGPYQRGERVADRFFGRGN